MYFSGTKPPEELVFKWIEKEMNDIDTHEVGVRITVCETQLQHIDGVPQERQEAYNDALENVKVNLRFSLNMN